MRSAVSGPINLAGKTAIVTGAAKGIGACIARTLAREGADVIVTDVLDTEKTAAEIVQLNRRSLGLKCDVRQPDQVNDLVHTAIRQFGQIDILVANAAIVERTPLLEMSLDEWEKTLRVNLTGAFLTVQAVSKHMAVRKQGKIVCLGSIAGKIGGVISGPSYVASKGGVHSFIKSAAKELAPLGIHINGVAPGPVNSDMTVGIPYQPEAVPLGRMGEPEDIAEAVLFLASQASNFITGQVLNVNGGIFME
jgi:3-oxoacyl-[acyl-carrier protein] reductase